MLNHFKKLFPSLLNSLKRLKDNPQLWYTIGVAVLILLSFVFLADRFVTIAQDAQNRLVNVRLGALQDSFVEFAPDYLENEQGILKLNKLISKINVSNNTVRRFDVYKFDQARQPVLIASLDRNKEPVPISEALKFKIKLAETDFSTSFTTEEFVNGERLYSTVRIIANQYDEPEGVVVTEQYLSEADAKINNSINNSLLIFIVIVILIMFLFFRHSRIIDYSSLYKRLQEVDSLKDDFISMASHELRTPLTIIRGYTEEVKEKVGSGDQEVNQSLERIDLSAKQLDELVTDMLDVSRIEQGRMKLNLEKILPLNLIKEIVDSYKIVAQEKGLELSFENNGSEAINIKVDPSRLKQVVVNMVGNAIKYTIKGSIAVKLSKVGKSFEIRVSDTGMGISSDEQKNLFQKFYRIQNSEVQAIRGTGLGLWITKQMVELMGGVISVESIKGVGTHFIVRFPIEK